MSVLCALAPSIGLLTVTRTLQGIGGAAVAVVAMAVVRDLFSGIRAAQLLSRLVLVLGVAPILAPSLGSALLAVTSWRGIFVVLAIAAVGCFVLAFVALPETLPVERRQPGQRPRLAAGVPDRSSRDRLFMVMVLVAGLMFATLFAYISGAPFVLQGPVRDDPAAVRPGLQRQRGRHDRDDPDQPVLVKRYSPVSVLSFGRAAGLDRRDHPARLIAAGLRWLARLHGPAVLRRLRRRPVLPERPGHRAEPARRIRRYRGGPARRLPVHDRRRGRPLVGLFANGTPVPMAAIMVGTTGLAAVLLVRARKALSKYDYR